MTRGISGALIAAWKEDNAAIQPTQTQSGALNSTPVDLLSAHKQSRKFFGKALMISLIAIGIIAAACCIASAPISLPVSIAIGAIALLITLPSIGNGFNAHVEINQLYKDNPHLHAQEVANNYAGEGKVHPDEASKFRAKYSPNQLIKYKNEGKLTSVQLNTLLTKFQHPVSTIFSNRTVNPEWHSTNMKT
ncbi:MAG: hypothetical protein P0S95_01985 [Rhabdochlamydiaceae bacterium]|nr:hypothetical protein [Candidatus Amphrikana amoebophyrae]